MEDVVNAPVFWKLKAISASSDACGDFEGSVTFGGHFLRRVWKFEVLGIQPHEVMGLERLPIAFRSFNHATSSKFMGRKSLVSDGV